MRVAEEAPAERPLSEISSSVSVVIAAYNEAPRLFATLECVWKTLQSDRELDWEVIAVNDGSSDETAEVLEQFAQTKNAALRVIHHASNRGLIEAMRSGSAAASKNTVVFLDADLSYAADIVGQLVRAKRATGADLAIASPYMARGRVANVPFDRLLASRLANWLLSACAGGRLRTFTGMVRAYDANLLRELFSCQPVGEFNSWAAAASIAAGRRIVEIPAALVWPAARAEGRGRMSLAGLWNRVKLVLTTAAFVQASCRGTANVETGTLVLGREPRVPYSLLHGAQYN